MATMIDHRPSLHGEAVLWDKLKEYLPNQDIVYNNREINGREFDTCVLLNYSGILIIEVKGWRSDAITVSGIDQIMVEGYSTLQRSPKKQARAYRFALLNKITEKYNVSPLVFDMVCYPFISKAEYLAKRLDIISEEQLTIFQDDLETAEKLTKKIQTAYDIAKKCPHSALTEDLINKLRQDWEPHYAPIKISTAPYTNNYSLLSVFPHPIKEETIKLIADAYFRGTKQIVFVADANSYHKLIETINQGFNTHNVQPRGNNLSVGFSNGIQSMNMKWQQVKDMASAKPVLAVIKQLYDALQPWKNHSTSLREQHHYMINHDYLLERIIAYSKVDSLTLAQIAEYLRINIITGQEQLSRNDDMDDGEIRMICTTVHKSKGLEYGTIILPYTDEEIDNPRKIKIDANYRQSNLAYTVQFDNKIRETNSNYDFTEEIDEQIAEESRILYVALTRAIHNCVWIKNLDSQPRISWSTLLEA